MLISSTVEDSYKKADPVMITQKKSFLGNFIGKYSKYFVILWFLIFGSSFSFFFDLPNKPTQPDLTFTKIDASARREVLANVQFFGGKGEPFYMGFFARAINGKNMMDSKLFTQFEKIYRKTEKFILTDDANNTLSINNSNNTIKPTTFLDICEPFCTFNEVLFGFMNGRDTAMLLSMFTEPPMINYPTTSLFGYNINIGKHLFERSYDERKSMIGANISALYYTTMVTSPRKKALLLSFEEQVIRLVTEHNSNQSRDFDLVCIGEARVGRDVMNGLEHYGKLVLIGIILYLITFFTLYHFFISWKFNFGRSANYLYGVLILLVPLFSTLIAFRIETLFSNDINFLFVATPWVSFIYLLTTVKALLLLQNWMYYHNVSNTTNVPFHEKLSNMYHKYVTVISCLLVGEITSMMVSLLFIPLAYRQFLYFIVLLIVAVNFSIFFLLTPLLVYFKKSAQGHVYDNGQQNGAKDRTKKKKAVVGMFKKIFSLGIADILTSGCGKCFSFVLIVICVIIIPSVKISDISVGLDLRQLVKSDSLSVDGFDIVEKTVWPDSLSTVFIIERPPDFTNESQFIAFKEMIDDFELMENNFGREGNQMWVFDYMRTTDQQWNTTTKLNMDHFEKFITTFPYKDWQTACQYDLSNKTHPVIKKMLYMATNIGVSSIREKLILMEKVRNKTNLYYETFKIIPFDTDSISIDIVKQTWDSMTYATSFLAVGILVSLTFLIPQIATWSVAAFSIISSIFCFIVYSNFLVPQITPFSIVTIIIFVVTISTIIVIQIYEFYRLLDVQGRRKRIAATFNNVSFILYIAALSTIASSIPLLFCQVSLYYDCAVFIITAMTIILVQFTYFVPALFAILPRSLVSD